jgi:hypothetical protein
VVKRFLTCVLLLVLGLGGTCASGEREREAACAKVHDALEMVRNNIGGWCGTPNLTAHEEMVKLGAAAVPCLRDALADRDPEVAHAAARVLWETKRGPVVEGWCREHGNHPNKFVCTNGWPPERSKEPSAH